MINVRIHYTPVDSTHNASDGDLIFELKELWCVVSAIALGAVKTANV